MSRRPSIAALACALTFLVVGVSTGAAAPSSLLLPPSTAFSILGYSCGGIQEQAFATGFDPSTGYPTGDVYIQTRCGASGRGGGYHSTTYSAWVGVTWDFAGNVLASARLTTALTVSATFSATDANGDEVYNTGTAAYLVVPRTGRAHGSLFRPGGRPVPGLLDRCPSEPRCGHLVDPNCHARRLDSADPDGDRERFGCERARRDTPTADELRDHRRELDRGRVEPRAWSARHTLGGV